MAGPNETIPSRFHRKETRSFTKGRRKLRFLVVSIFLATIEVGMVLSIIFLFEPYGPGITGMKLGKINGAWVHGFFTVTFFHSAAISGSFAKLILSASLIPIYFSMFLVMPYIIAL